MRQLNNKSVFQLPTMNSIVHVHRPHLQIIYKSMTSAARGFVMCSIIIQIT